jgi:hypothetical protein
MKTNCKFLIFITLASILMPTNLRATDNQVTLGGGDYNSKPLLRIVLQTGGYYGVYRKISGTYTQQFYSQNCDAIAVRIGSTVYCNDFAFGGDVPFTVSDVGTPIIGPTVPVESATKRYSASHNSRSFHVDLTWQYDKRNPDYFTVTAEIDTRNIPVTEDISLAYGFDTYVNGTLYSAAITYPDQMRSSTYLNGSESVPDYLFTTAEVRNLYMVGCINNEGTGSLMAYFTMGGRPFDRAYSAYFPNAYPNYFVLGSTASVFNYYPFSDNGLAVAYDNIPGAAVTSISTGMTFVPTLPAKVGYGFQQGSSFSTVPSQHLTVPMNTPASLRITASNDHSEAIDNVAFQVNMPTTPTSLTISGTPTHTGFTTPPTVHTTDGSTYYQVANVEIPALGASTVMMPVSTAVYGEWTIDELNFSNMSYIMPIGGEQAILTVTTEVNCTPAGNFGISTGSPGKTFTVKLPGTETAVGNINIILTPVTSTPGSFSTIPTYVTIPSGSNSTTFTVIANPGAADNDNITITLSSDYAPVIIGSGNEVTLTVGPSIHYIPVNPHLMSKIIIP